MKINFLTLFPKYYEPFQTESIIKNAIEKGIVEINVVDLRDFATNKHGKIDDECYGGGSGMLIMVEPVDLALQTLGGRKILMSPQGRKFDQKIAEELASYDEITLIAGHYEGFDDRVKNYIDEEMSIGDYVLTGGELPSMVIADSVIRLLKGVIKEESHKNDSFQNDLLDYPQYTRPADYKGHKVPEVLLSGHHKNIEAWRKEQAYLKTKQLRPDLLEKKGSNNEK